MRIHEIKTLPHFYTAVITGEKKFELRHNDRDYRVGDVLKLMEYDNERAEYTGRQTFYRVTYVLHVTGDPVIESVIMSIEPVVSMLKLSARQVAMLVKGLEAVDWLPQADDEAKALIDTLRKHAETLHVFNGTPYAV